MKIKIEHAIDIPDMLASMLIGSRIDPTFGVLKDFTINLDEEGAKRFSTILHFMYSSSDRYKEYRSAQVATSGLPVQMQVHSLKLEPEFEVITKESLPPATMIRSPQNQGDAKTKKSTLLERSRRLNNNNNDGG